MGWASSKHFEDLRTDGRIIKPELQEVVRGGMNWIYLFQDRERQWAFVNAVMNPRVP